MTDAAPLPTADERRAARSITRRRAMSAALAAGWVLGPGRLARAAAATDAATEGAAAPRFATATEAAAVLAGAEDGDAPYIDRLNLRELKARMPSLQALDDVDAARAAFRRGLADHALDFDAEERAALSEAVAWLQGPLAARLPALGRLPWRFLKVDDSVEAGMPHTRGRWIVLPRGELGGLVDKVRGRGGRTRGVRQAAWLLAHEQAHVLQRARPALFAPLYTEVLGFRRLAPAPHAPWLDAHAVTNPDGPDLEWAWRPEGAGEVGWVLPALILGDRARVLQDFAAVALALQPSEGGRLALSPRLPAQGLVLLSKVEGYAAAFPWTDENFHPNEIAADLLAKLVVEGDDDEASIAPGSVHARARAWALQALR